LLTPLANRAAVEAEEIIALKVVVVVVPVLRDKSDAVDGATNLTDDARVHISNCNFSVLPYKHIKKKIIR
jgi:hypothetical protein